MADRAGQQLGPYHLIGLLGQSDWAAVYLGEHLSLHMQVALKVFSLRLTGGDVERFRTEVSMLARLRPSALLRLLDCGMEGDLPFLVMDYAPGGSLRQRHPRGTILPAPLMLSSLQPVVATLQYLHDQGRIHGNIKPENMLLGWRNEVLLSDIGLPLLTQRRQSLLQQQGASAAAYLAPEQLQDQPQPSSDQYALGIIVYEWLSGDVPFHGSFDETAQQHLSVSPMPLREKIPSISPHVEHVVLKALAKDPHQRFASVRAFAEELAQACQPTQATRGEPQPSSPALLPLVPTVKLSPPATDAPAPGTIICTYRGHAHRVHAAAWSPDGWHIASGSWDKTVQIWEATTGKLAFSLEGQCAQWRGRPMGDAWLRLGTMARYASGMLPPVAACSPIAVVLRWSIPSPGRPMESGLPPTALRWWRYGTASLVASASLIAATPTECMRWPGPRMGSTWPRRVMIRRSSCGMPLTGTRSSPIAAMPMTCWRWPGPRMGSIWPRGAAITRSRSGGAWQLAPSAPITAMRVVCMLCRGHLMGDAWPRLGGMGRCTSGIPLRGATSSSIAVMPVRPPIGLMP